MSLNRRQISYLRSLAHPLPHVVTIGGAGLSDSVIAELESSLQHHELLKIKISSDNRELRKKIAEEICSSTGAEMIQLIGKVAIIFKPSEKQKIKLPA